MTCGEFTTRRAWGQIAPETQVRTVLFRFNGSSVEWAEIFVDERYLTIEQQEEDFRRKLSVGAQFLTPPGNETVSAKNWVRFEIQDLS